MNELSEKHQAFVAEYIANKFNATQAYMKVYECDYDTAHAVSYRLLAHDGIRAAIDAELDIILSNKREIAAEVVETWARVMRETQSESIRIRAGEMLAKYFSGMSEKEVQDDKIDELIRKLNDRG